MGNGTKRAIARRMFGAVAAAAVLLCLGNPAAADGPEGAQPLPEQPDGQISKNASTYTGNGVYNTTGAGQTASRNAARGTTVRFYIRTQNDGDDSMNLRVQGCAGTASFAVKYFGVLPSLPPFDLTSQVIAGSSAPLSPGLTADWMVEVKVKPTAAAGATLNCKFKLSAPEGASTLKDTVLMTVRRS